MKLYNIAQCAEELARTDYTTEQAKPKNKHFRIFDKVYGVISLAMNKRGAMQAIAEKLSNRASGTEPHAIDLKFYAYDNRRAVVPYNDPDEITAEELNSTETEELNAALDWLLDFSRTMSQEFYYMVEWGNGYTEETAAAYNFYAYTQHEGELPEGMPKNAEKWIAAAFPYQSDSVARDIKREQEQRERRKKFFDAYQTIFDACLHFNIDMGLDNEKAGGIAEQTAIEFVESLGGYNGFTPRKFEKIIDYCNKYFTKYYRAGNPNNYIKDYKIYFGREASVVMYLETNFKSDDEITATLDELSEIARPDELTIVEQFIGYNGKPHAKIRLWWD